MNSSQLELPFAEWKREPWSGVSPRTLTRARMALFLRREPQKDDCFFVDPNQLRFAFAEEKAPWEYQGAPSLLPFKEV